MKISPAQILQRVVCLACALLLAAALVLAQTNTGTVRGQVTDPSSAAVVGATILLTVPGGASMDTKTDDQGFYQFKDLAPGTYEVKVVSDGFAIFTRSDVAVVAGQTTRVNAALNIEIQQEKVTVNSTTTQVDVNPASNANSIVLTSKDMDALSDDPDEMASELQALAGPSAGPNGGQIYIDGFTAGQLPPKASIREIRINQNPFSPEYDKLGYGRIEIYTKPGTDRLHGQFMVMGNSSAFNSRNPFEHLPEEISPPDYHSTQYSGNVGGALNKKTSFFFNIEHRNIGALNVVNGTVVCGDQYLVIACPLGTSAFSEIPYSTAENNPMTRTNLSPRIDFQLTPNNTLTVRYQYFRDVENGNGVGQFFLPELGTNDFDVEHTLQVTDTQTINASTINEIRFQFIHEDTEKKPVNGTTTVGVGGAFTGVGYGGGGLSDQTTRYEVQDILYKTYSKHAWKFGFRVRPTTDTNATLSGFTGEFTFGSRPDPNCTAPSPSNNNCVITPIDAYQRTVQGLANGLTIPQIQVLGGGATYFNLNTGLPTTKITVVDAGIFVQDDWKIRQNVTLSYGLRFETQNEFSDHADWAPRVGIAWGVRGNAKNPPKTVIRAGFGIFYDRFSSGMLLTQERLRFSANEQRQYLFTNPTFFLDNIPSCSSSPASCPTAVATTYLLNNNLRAPETIQTGVTVERQLTKSANIALTYLNSRGVHLFYTNNVNPVDPVSGDRVPVPGVDIPQAVADSNVFQYQSEGYFKQNQLIVNGSIRMGTKLSLFGYYTLNHANSNTLGGSGFGGGAAVASFPSNPYNLQQDWGRANYDVRNRVFLGGLIGLPRGFRLFPFMIASSGVPFNITTGDDLYQDSQFNMRPAFASCSAAGATQTKYGCFEAAPPAGYTPIPVNHAEGPGRFTLNLRLSKTFGFGPAVERNAGGGGPGVGGGTFGRPGGGPRGGMGGRGMDASATNHRYALTFAVVGRNIFNNVNETAPIGNLGSPLFGESNGLAPRPFSDPTSNRRIDLQMTFSF
jgi:hypothetical protein